MKTKVMLAFSLLLLLVAKGTEGQTYGRATFNIRGITGHITFMPQPGNNTMMIMSNISGTTTMHNWHVHLLPVDSSLPPATRCSNDLIGGHFDPFGASSSGNYGTYCGPNNQTACEVGDLSGKLGALKSGVQRYNETSGDLVLFGENGIIGRSIKIHGTEDVCATIVSSTELNGSPTITMLKAAFTYPVGGMVYMRQVMGERAVIFGKLYWVNNANTTMNHKWSIRMDKPSQYYREGNCNNLGNVVSDLSNTHGNIAVSNAPQPYRALSFFFQDASLSLTGSANGGSLVINSNSQSNDVLACAPLVEVETLNVRANNRFTASQSSRFASTLVTTGYSPSSIRIFSSAIAPNSLCKDEFTAGRSRIYNPHTAPPLDGSGGTPDRYPVGNFSIKYRSFNASGSRVTELPIHGYETISGHSLGYMSRGSSGMTHSCSSLWPQYPSGSNVKMAKATFNGTVAGAIYFIQRNFGNEVLGMTHIMVDIWYTNSSTAQTSGHKWHIHERPPQAGMRCVEAIGGHFNPFNVDLNNNYGTECTPYAPLRCESGDLSGKHSKLNISAASPTRPTYTYVDNNLHLWGPANYSIIGRSIGLHSTAGPLFDCGPITEIVFSSRNRSISFPYDANFDRTNFAAQLTRNAKTASPSDVLILDQEMTTDSSGNTGCVTATISTVGGSTEEADDTFNSLEIPDSCTSNPPSSSAMMLPSLFLILFSIMLVIAGAI